MSPAKIEYRGKELFMTRHQYIEANSKCGQKYVGLVEVALYYTPPSLF